LSEERLAGYPVVVRIPVQWGEMDAYGHVNNTVFFRYFESARILYLERCGFLEAYEREKVGAILHSTSCRFRRALFYPDTAVIGTRAAEVNDDRFTMAYEMFSEAQDAVVAEGTGIVVSFDYVSRQVVQIPDFVRAKIDEMESLG
jgi:acyl-CoA thioester hydrolase